MGTAPPSKPAREPSRPFAPMRQLSFKRRRNKPSTLLRLIARQAWQKVLIRVSMFPKEINKMHRMTLYAIEWRVLPLHLACTLKAPTPVIESLINDMTARQYLVRVGVRKNRKRDDQLPPGSFPVLKTAQIEEPDPTSSSTSQGDSVVVTEDDSKGWEGVHRSPNSNKNSKEHLSVVASLTESPPSPLQWNLDALLGQVEHMLPLHLACLYGAESAVIELLLRNYPESARITCCGMLPIHMACANLSLPPPIPAPLQEIHVEEEFAAYPPSTLQHLMNAFPDCASVCCPNGMAPRDYILRCIDDDDCKARCLDTLVGMTTSDLRVRMITPLPSEDGDDEDNDDGDDDDDNDQAEALETFSVLPEDRERIRNQGNIPLEIHCDDGTLPSLPDDSMLTPKREEMSCQGDSPLFTLLMYHRWDAASDVLRRSPQMASEWTYGTEMDALEPVLWKRLPIHHACRFGAPLCVVEALVNLYPESASAKDPCLCVLPLHLACRYRCSTKVVSFLLHEYPQAARERDVTGRLPLHFACLNAISSTVIYKLLQAYPASVCVKDRSGKTPLEYTTVETGIDAETLALLDKLRRFLNRVERRRKEEKKRKVKTPAAAVPAPAVVVATAETEQKHVDIVSPTTSDTRMI